MDGNIDRIVVKNVLYKSLGDFSKTVICKLLIIRRLIITLKNGY